MTTTPTNSGFYKLTGQGSMDGIYLLVFHDEHDPKPGQHNLFRVERGFLRWTFPGIIAVLDADNWLTPQQAVGEFLAHEGLMDAIYGRR